MGHKYWFFFKNFKKSAIVRKVTKPTINFPFPPCLTKPVSHEKDVNKQHL